ncbi:hypothetical protein C404_18150 [Ralstonia sp. AU12-08]|nr:hypothetical protein C404_18150 [Ralstonia sp. AU12-08]
MSSPRSVHRISPDFFGLLRGLGYRHSPFFCWQRLPALPYHAQSFGQHQFARAGAIASIDLLQRRLPHWPADPQQADGTRVTVQQNTCLIDLQQPHHAHRSDHEFVRSIGF